MSGAHPLCCYSCAPYIELAKRSQAEEIPSDLEKRLEAEYGPGLIPVDRVLDELGWKNPFEEGTAQLK